MYVENLAETFGVGEGRKACLGERWEGGREGKKEGKGGQTHGHVEW